MTKFSFSWQVLVGGVLLVAWSRLLMYIVYSFSWPMDGDLAFLYYISWLMNEHDFVPYLDVHETSFFGTFIFYSLLTRLTGYSTLAFHWADTVLFVLLGLLTLRLMRGLGLLCGLLAVAIFGEFYYKMGFGVHLQRDYIALLPAVLALVIVQEDKVSLRAKSLAAGFLFGIASCIKPQFAGGALFTTVFIALQANNLSMLLWLKIITTSVAGFASAWGLGFAWLAYHGVVDSFLSMAFDYLPAYTSINGRNFARENADAWSGACKWLWGMLQTWLPMLLVSMYLAWRALAVRHPGRYQILVLFLLWILYMTYVPMAGKYWGYHTLPSYYFLALVLATITPGLLSKEANAWMVKAVAVGIWLLFYAALVADESIQERNAQASESARDSVALVGQLTRYLKDNLKPGETTQAHVSHTRGAVFPALLEARALPATPYLENYLLYHDIDSPFVTRARDKFLQALQQHPPRFIVYTPTLFPFRGPGTEIMFMPFEKWMGENYRLVYIPQTPSRAAFQRVEVYEYRDLSAATK